MIFTLASRIFTSCLSLAVSMTVIAVAVIPAQAMSPGPHLSVEELYRSYRVPGTCGQKLQGEGVAVLVKGKIDYDNVFEHSRYPQLPYEKFSLEGRERKLEVVAISPDNATLFEKINAARREGKGLAYVRGTVRGVDLHIMGPCQREIRLELSSPEDIYFR